MKITPLEIVYKDTRQGKFGNMHNFKIRFTDQELNEITGYYTTNDQGFNEADKAQRKFKEGEEAEIELIEMKGKEGKSWYKVKPAKQAKFQNSPYAKNLQREQTKYSGFSASYVKDLIVAGILKPETDEEAIKENDQIFLTWRKRSKEIFDHLVKLDESINQESNDSN